MVVYFVPCSMYFEYDFRFVFVFEFDERMIEKAFWWLNTYEHLYNIFKDQVSSKFLLSNYDYFGLAFRIE